MRTNKIKQKTQIIVWYIRSRWGEQVGERRGKSMQRWRLNSSVSSYHITCLCTCRVCIVVVLLFCFCVCFERATVLVVVACLLCVLSWTDQAGGQGGRQGARGQLRTNDGSYINQALRILFSLYFSLSVGTCRNGLENASGYTYGYSSGTTGKITFVWSYNL